MAAIVTTLAYIPVGALVALLAFGAFDVPLHSLLTFGGQILRCRAAGRGKQRRTRTHKLLGVVSIGNLVKVKRSEAPPEAEALRARGSACFA